LAKIKFFQGENSVSLKKYLFFETRDPWQLTKAPYR